MTSELKRSADRSRKAGEKIVQDLQAALRAQPGGKNSQARLGGVVAEPPRRYKRDTQTTNVYAAQRQIRLVLDNQLDQPLVSVAGSTIAVPLERKFADIESIQTYCTNVLNSLWPDYSDAIRAGVKVRARKGFKQAHYEQGGVIAIPVSHEGRWAMTQMVVCHELAHHLAGAGHSHDEHWVRAFIDLLGREMGPEMALLTRCTFGEHEVRL